MRHIGRVSLLTISVLIAAAGLCAENPAAERRSLVVTLNDGHRQSFPLAEVARIDFKDGVTVVLKDGHSKLFSLSDIGRIEFTPAADSQFGRNHFLGKWEVGDGAGSNFYITLESNGQAHKTLGSSHGTWIVVDGEARISWEDGWHDMIRKVGAKHEKVAFAPGKNFDDDPDNVTNARNTTPEPI